MKSLNHTSFRSFKAISASLLTSLLILVSTHSYSNKDTITLTTIPSLTSMFPDVQNKVEKAFVSLGYPVRFFKLPEARAMKTVEFGKYDGELLREHNYDKYVDNMVSVPVSLAQTQIRVITQIESPINSIEDLKGKNVGVLRGAPILVDKLISVGAIPIEFIDFTQGSKMISRNRIDAALLPEQLIPTIAKNQLEVALLDEPLMKIDFLLWMNVKHSHLIKPLAKQLTQN